MMAWFSQEWRWLFRHRRSVRAPELHEALIAVIRWAHANGEAPDLTQVRRSDITTLFRTQIAAGHLAPILYRAWRQCHKRTGYWMDLSRQEQLVWIERAGMILWDLGRDS